MNLTPEQATKILAADQLNLARQVSEGRPLSNSQVARLQAVAAAKGTEGTQGTEVVERFVSKQTELAEALDVTRKTISRWMKEPGRPETKADGRYDVVAWREFARSKGHLFSEAPDAASAKAQQILLQNEKLRFNLNVSKKAYIPKVTAQQVFGKLMLSAKSRCYSSLVRFATLARMAKDTTDATEELRKEMDAIWQAVADSKWLKSDKSDG